MDVLNDPLLEDLSSPLGFLLALKLTLRLKPGALLFGGVPCSTYFGLNKTIQHLNVKGLYDI